MGVTDRREKHVASALLSADDIEVVFKEEVTAAMSKQTPLPPRPFRVSLLFWSFQWLQSQI